MRHCLGRFVLVILSAGLALGGCSAGSDNSAARTKSASLFTAALSGKGASIPTYEQFRDSLYREPEGAFIVDYDVAVPDEKQLRDIHDKLVERLTNPGATARNALIVDRVSGSDNVWSDTARRDITYCVSGAFGSRKQLVLDRLAAAGTAWQAAANVVFRHVPAQDADCRAGIHNVVFDVRPVISGNYLARAFFPNDARRYSNLMIDNTAFVEDAENTLLGTLTHELGHTLGFRHEHTRPEAKACFEDNDWRAVTSYDPYSVMHYPQCNGRGNNLAMTDSDRSGARAIYGAPGGPPAPPPTSVVNSSGSLIARQRVVLGPYAVKVGTTLEAVLSGTGDPDVYVRHGSEPTLRTYACRPYLEGPDETCAVTATAEPLYVMVHSYSPATYALTIRYAPR